MKRTDEHRPSAIVPTEYEYVGIECMRIDGIGDVQAVLSARERIKLHMLETGGTYSAHAHGGNCHVCGAACVYTHLFYHAKSNSYIRTGNDCTDRLDYASVAEDMDAFKHAIKPALELAKGKRKAQEMLNVRGMTTAWDLYLAASAKEFHSQSWAERKLKDVMYGVITYGKMTDKQASFIKSLVAQCDPKVAAEREAKQAAVKAEAADCPTGRVEITGSVISTKAQASDFGTVQKMLVQHATGYRVWVSIPSGICAERGVEVTFTATITPSKNDPKFGFGSHPVAKKVKAA